MKKEVLLTNNQIDLIFNLIDDRRIYLEDKKDYNWYATQKIELERLINSLNEAK